MQLIGIIVISLVLVLLWRKIMGTQGKVDELAVELGEAVASATANLETFAADVKAVFEKQQAEIDALKAQNPDVDFANLEAQVQAAMVLAENIKAADVYAQPASE